MAAESHDLLAGRGWFILPDPYQLTFCTSGHRTQPVALRCATSAVSSAHTNTHEVLVYLARVVRVARRVWSMRGAYIEWGGGGGGVGV